MTESECAQWGASTGVYVLIQPMPDTRALDPRTLAERVEALLSDAVPTAAVAALGAELADLPITADLLVAAAAPLRRRAVALDVPPNRVVIDIVDATGADRGLLDVPFVAGLLVAACDGTVAHHAALRPPPLLARALGVSPVHTPAAAREALVLRGYAALAPDRFHGSLGRLAPLLAAAPRFFALLAPLLHPAGAPVQVVAVDAPGACAPLLDALVACGAPAAVVHCTGGAPWLSASGDTVGLVWREGKRTLFVEAGTGAPESDLASGGAARDAARVVAAFGAGGDAVLGGAVATVAGTALWAAGILPTLEEARGWAATRLAQGVDLAELGAAPASATSRTRTTPASAPTSPRSPRPPRAAARPARDRRG